jgi:hypothetical protein
MARLSGRWGASIVLQPRMVGRGEGEYFSSLLNTHPVNCKGNLKIILSIQQRRNYREIIET